MKKIIVLLLLIASAAFGQTTTSVTGTVKDLTNTAVASGQVSFTLQPGIDTMQSGIARFTPTEVDCSITGTGAVKALDGVSTCTVVNNTSLQPANTFYKVCIQPQFVSPGSCFGWYATGTATDITQQVPTPPLTPAYNLVDTFSNQTVAGNKTFTGTVTFGGSLSLGALTLGGAFTDLFGGTLGGTFAGNPTFSGNVSVGGTLGVTGLASLKNLEGIRFAADFAGSSTTCGIAEAIAALPSSCGKVILQSGNCSAAGWPVAIQKCVVIEGQGMGGPTDPGTNASVLAGSSLTNTGTSGSFFAVNVPVSGSNFGATFLDFAMIGNKQVVGATAGDCIDINGGTTAQQTRAVTIERVHCNQPKGSGWVVQDNAFEINIINSYVEQSGSHCMVVKNGPNSGIPSQIHIIGSTLDLCGGSNVSFSPGTADALNISGSTARTIDITDSTLADSNNGINVVAGATNTSIHAFSSDFESNTTCDVSLNDGLVHRISSNTMFGGGTFGLHGVCTNMPVGAAAQQNQLFMDANWFGGHTSQDVLIGVNQKTGLILPQNSNIYTYSDASGNVIREDLFSGGLELTAGGLGFFPASNGGSQLGGASFAWSTVFTFGLSVSELTAPSGAGGKDVCYGDSTAHALECSYNNGAFFRIPQVIGSGTASMTTAGIATGACGTTVTVGATGVATTDIINISHNAAATIGNGGGLTLNAWPTANNVNFNYCNSAAGTITPTAMTINWQVTR